MKLNINDIPNINANEIMKSISPDNKTYSEKYKTDIVQIDGDYVTVKVDTGEIIAINQHRPLTYDDIQMYQYFHSIKNTPYVKKLLNTNIKLLLIKCVGDYSDHYIRDFDHDLETSPSDFKNDMKQLFEEDEFDDLSSLEDEEFSNFDTVRKLYENDEDIQQLLDDIIEYGSYMDPLQFYDKVGFPFVAALQEQIVKILKRHYRKYKSIIEQ